MNNGIDSFTKELMKLNKVCRQQRQVVPDDLIYSDNNYKIAFHSTGCEFSKLGFCAMCEYGKSNIKMTILRLKKALDEIFVKYKEPIDWILFGSNGSIMDEREFPAECFDYLLEYLSHKDIKTVCFETFYTTVTQSKIDQIKELLPNKNIEIEFGFESASEEIRQKCFLKFINNDLMKFKLKLLRDNNIYSYLIKED